VCYDMRVTSDAFFLAIEWSTDDFADGVQNWTQFVYRRRLSRAPPSVVRLDPVHDVVPVPFRLPRDPDSAPDVAAVSPRSFNGVKRVIDARDVSSLSLAGATPKFDGLAGVLLVGGSVAAFTSSTYNLSFSLCRAYTARMAFAAELVSLDRDSAVVVVLGAISVADTECDPYNPADLDAVRSVLRPLAADGIVVTSTTLTDTVSDDGFARIGPLTGRHLLLPVDGYNVVIGGRSGCFLKPLDRCTVDARLDESERLISDASEAAGFGESSVDLAGYDLTRPSTVLEFRLSNPTVGIWVPCGVRADKKFSNTLGRTIVDVAAAYAMFDVVGDGGPKQMRNVLA